MIGIGYDRDFSQVVLDGRALAPMPSWISTSGWQHVEVSAERREIRIPPAMQLDLGSTAKALAADRAAVRAAGVCGCGVLVSLGGDIAVGGDAPQDSWQVGIADDHAGVPEPGETVAIASGGLATSSTTVRRWMRGGVPVHHILDPRTGLSAHEVWRTVSVCAATCVDANTASTAAVVLGEEALDWLARRGLPATSGTHRRVDRPGSRVAGDGVRMIGASSSRAVWYLTRGTGAVSLLLLTATMVLGILNLVRWSPSRTPRFVVQRVHRNVSLLSVVFILIHIATAVIDGFAPIRWIDTVVPFRSAYRPIWLGLGAVAFDLLIAIAVTSLLRAHLGARLWRAIHWTSYALWGFAVFHGLGVGSDSTQLWMIGLVVVSVGAVVAAVAWRVTVGWPEWTPARLAMVTGAVVMPVVLGAWFVAGPLQPGWAARAGTPRQLLVHTGTTAPSPSPTIAPDEPPIVLPANAAGQGTTRLHHLSRGGARVVVTLQTQGSPELSILVTLNGQPIPGGGVTMSDGSAALTPPEGAAAYQGSVTGLAGETITAELADGQGDRIALTLELQISSTGRTEAQVLIQGLATGTAQA